PHTSSIALPTALPISVEAFIKTPGAITDRVMAAMEAADGSGGDSRCTCPPWPTDGSKPKIPCDEKTAHVAYILMAEKGDTNGDRSEEHTSELQSPYDL